ncbi:hypothetical protein BS17DRAFT_777478 [Gyrodon lividus]|nr:hypothetical protein BS17DRAFT_777478 [Gyrodon lividus]
MVHPAITPTCVPSIYRDCPRRKSLSSPSPLVPTRSSLQRSASRTDKCSVSSHSRLHPVHPIYLPQNAIEAPLTRLMAATLVQRTASRSDDYSLSSSSSSTDPPGIGYENQIG